MVFKKGSEIIELRKQINLLEKENSILRKRLGQEEQMQVESLVTHEIQQMSLPELKSKIVKLAQAYRGERMRNEEYEKALKQAQVEISQARKLAHDLEALQKQHEDDSERFLQIQKETQKISLYRETIKKQEEVIKKLESVLDRTMKDNSVKKDNLLEMEQLRTENLRLQRELKDMVIQATPGTFIKPSEDLEKYKSEINRLEKQITSLQYELSNRRPMSADKRDMQNEILDLEVRLHKAQSRVSSLETEMISNARKYGEEIARLKTKISEKESIIETLRMENNI